MPPKPGALKKKGGPKKKVGGPPPIKKVDPNALPPGLKPKKTIKPGAKMRYIVLFSCEIIVYWN